jgi:hypothetical protein
VKPGSRRAWLLAAGLALVGGCDSSSAKDSATSTPVVSAATTAQQSASSAPAAPTTSAVESTPSTSVEPTTTSVQPFGPGSFDLPDPTTGLADLSSYQATLTLAFDGTKDGQPEAWTLTKTIAVSGDPAARSSTEEQTGAAPHSLARVDVGGVTYEIADDGPCDASTTPAATDPTAAPDDEATDEASDNDEPAAALSGLFGAEEQADEPIDGISATHYTFDERAFGALDPATSAGDVWIASDGGYVVRYTLVTEGASGFLGHGVTGRLTTDYNVTSVNQPVTVSVPDGCGPGLVDAPLLADAANVVSRPGQLSYSTSSATPDALGFYQQQLVAAGWVPTSDPVTDETLTQTVSTFTRADETLSVILSAAPPGTTVTLLLSAGQT